MVYREPPSDGIEPDPDWDTLTRAEYLEDKAKTYRTERNDARRQRDEVTAHATLAGSHLQVVQSQLNEKTKRKASTRNIHINSRITTSVDGIAEAKAQEKAREEKETKAEEREREKEKALGEKCLRRLLGREAIVFKGLLSTQKVAGLRDVAWSLSLSDKGTQKELLARIKEFFATHTEKQNDAQHQPLFAKAPPKHTARQVAAPPEPPIAESSAMGAACSIILSPTIIQHSPPAYRMPHHSGTTPEPWQHTRYPPHIPAAMPVYGRPPGPPNPYDYSVTQHQPPPLTTRTDPFLPHAHRDMPRLSAAWSRPPSQSPSGTSTSIPTGRRYHPYHTAEFLHTPSYSQ